jgi:glycosyltransferase involved in cell wall biosynthesis
MRLLLLSFEYPPETGFGGIGTYTWYHARALARLGHDVHVLAGATEATPLRTTEQDGARVHRYRSRGPLMSALQPLAKLRLWWSKNRLENALSMYRGYRQLLRQYRFDLIEMPECGAEGALLNHLTRTPTVVRFHSPARLIMPYYDVRPADIRLCSRAEQSGIRGANAFTSCSRFLANEVRDRLGVQRPVRVIPNGIDLTLFDAEEQLDFRRQYGLPADRPIVLFSGRMERRKGIELFLTLAAPLLERHEVALVLAGQDLFNIVAGQLLPSLEGKRLRGSIHYLGKLDLASVRSAVRQADVFLLPSLWENCPYSCLEAMAAGRAIVSTDQGGMPELIRDGENGLLARNGDSASYLAALDRMLADAELRRRLGQAARTTIETSFTDIQIAQASVAHYLECLQQGGASVSPVLDTHVAS